MRARPAWFALVLLPACGKETVTLGIDFPSETSFVLTEHVEIDVVRARDCTDAALAVSSDRGRVVQSAAGTPCEVRAGTVVVDPIPSEELAFVVRAFHPDASPTEPILRGCRMVTIDRSPPAAVEIVLDYTPTYFTYEAMVDAAGGPACPTAISLCSGACVP